MKTISTEELRARLDAGPLALFDVRGDLEFELEHIPGAKTAPLGSLTFRVAGVMLPDSFVVVYSSGSDGLAAQAAERLADLRLKNVHCYDAGLAGWKAAGLPTVPSVNPKAHARGPVVECRPLVVDRETAYGGAFKQKPVDTDGAGG
jgi:rhodanese-related sulfurtransferase